MELKFDIGINELLSLIRQLSPELKLRIKKELEKDSAQVPDKHDNSDLKELLLSGPVMSKEEENNFKNFNENFDRWTKSLFA